MGRRPNAAKRQMGRLNRRRPSAYPDSPKILYISRLGRRRLFRGVRPRHTDDGGPMNIRQSAFGLVMLAIWGCLAGPVPAASMRMTAVGSIDEMQALNGAA